MWASPGTPCASVFLPVAVFGGDGAVVPSVLGDEGSWRAFSALSRAVEAAGDAGRAALEEVRGALAPVETSAWARADELWSMRAGPAPWVEAVAEWDARVRAALRGRSG
jgi:hypothetical protein